MNALFSMLPLYSQEIVSRLVHQIPQLVPPPPPSWPTPPPPILASLSTQHNDQLTTLCLQITNFRPQYTFNHTNILLIILNQHQTELTEQEGGKYKKHKPCLILEWIEVSSLRGSTFWGMLHLLLSHSPELREHIPHLWITFESLPGTAGAHTQLLLITTMLTAQILLRADGFSWNMEFTHFY